MLFALARAYAHCYVIVKAATGVALPGLGFLLRRCRKPRFLPLLGEYLYFEPEVASSYGLHIIGRVHEPESHTLLNAVFDALGNRPAGFAEVGANVGVFLLDVARRPNVQVLGFEPSAACISAIRRTMARNQRTNCLLFENLVGGETKVLPFDEGKDVQGASVHTSLPSSSRRQQIRLDDVEPLQVLDDDTPTVLMIDVEGYEPHVLRGATKLIRRLRPIIIFEYNAVSRQYFRIEDVAFILGEDYQIFRLRKDALLDRRTDDAWNCVAIPRNSEFEVILASRICAA